MAESYFGVRIRLAGAHSAVSSSGQVSHLQVQGKVSVANFQADSWVQPTAVYGHFPTSGGNKPKYIHIVRGGAGRGRWQPPREHEHLARRTAKSGSGPFFGQGPTTSPPDVDRKHGPDPLAFDFAVLLPNAVRADHFFMMPRKRSRGW